MKPWPIIVGILIDAVGSIMFGAAYVLAMFAWQGAPETPTGDELSGVLHVVAAEVVGLLLTALGGFVAAGMAGTQPVRHGATVGAGAAVIWLAAEFLFPIFSGGPGILNETLSVAASVLAGALGGWLAGLRQKSRSQPASGV